ncbi:uncharacterized protein LOC133800285 [Humulus lupulus]|uniref:uncharacterized protein LOC133800285 n=1 Tax=Humulus lupulus TaxID=3486 RepID=UPI002B40AF94|nr:uncharacterized protein LOC133800285 [Humulus lupulus]
MSLCLLVEGVLKGREEKLMVWTDMLKMVDDVDFFFQYPWGKISYQKLLQTCQKDFVEMKKHLQKKIEKGKTQKEPKYSIYGYAAALQYWAFESNIELGQDYAVRLGQGIPRMINWQSKEKVEIHKEQIIKLFAKKLTVYPYLCARPTEEQYVRTLTDNEAPLYVDMGLEELEVGADGQPTQEALQRQAEKLAEKLAEQEEASNIFKEVPPPPAPEAPEVPPSAPHASTSSQAEQPGYSMILARLEKVEGQQSALIKGQSEILGQLQKLMTMMEYLSRPAPDPHPQSTEEGPQSPVDEDILPNDYRPDDVDDHIFRTPEDMKITVIGDTEDSEWDASGYDGVYYCSFCHKGTMMHLDVAFHLMRRRLEFYPNLYPQNCVSMPTIFPESLKARWDAFPGSDYSSFSWDDSILDLVRGDAVQFLPSWQNKEFIYFSLFLKDQLHWVAVEADLNGWMLNIFDSSIGSISENDLISLMVDWCSIFPLVLRQSGSFENHEVILAPQLTASESQVKPFDWKLTPREFVPQTKSSGDCGCYVIEHIEHKLLQLPFDNVIDNNMKIFRQRWCVDLFYQNLC